MAERLATFGVVIGGHRHALPTVLELVRAVEAAGARSVILDGDSSFRPSLPDAPMIHSWTATGAVLHGTKRVEVGSLRLVTHWNAVALAKAVATLCTLHPGRFRFCIGLGEQSADTRAGVAAPVSSERVRWLDELLEVLPGLWAGDTVHFRGRYVAIDGVGFAATSDPPPIEIAARGPRMLRLVARHAARLDLNLPPVSRLVETANALLERACRQEGRDPKTIERSMWIATYPGGRAGADLYARYRKSRPWFPMLRDDELPEAVVAGSGTACLDRLEEIRETLKIDHPVIDLCSLSRDACLRALDALDT